MTILNPQIPKDAFLEIMQLINTLPTLITRNKLGAIVELWNLCETKAQRDLINDLLMNFFILDEDKELTACNTIADYINNLGLDYRNTLVIAAANSDEIDGSGAGLQKLKDKLIDAESWHSRLISNIPAGARKVKNNFTIILFDDFIGSGSKLIKKKKWFEKIVAQECPLVDLNTLSYYIVSFAGMFSGLEYIYEEGKITPFSAFILLKGISDAEKYKSCVPHKISLMKEIESKLSANNKNKKLDEYSLGYNSSETLYFSVNENCPNNVFPVFWWPKDKDGEIRETLLRRVG
ncbi:hypothetical protein KAM338_00010 [Aeromonas caviae]|uniref:phosphoribosyltransferase-like protein n=1 Tax=Aeromonas hydrophila TaxID=644 RepID=UPI0011C08489|nr:hypothetical protein [Aeromonas hydrophila]GKQ59824.1 hypothetical protein KAM338_00010 [Aeromonas caviae]MCV9382775.1 hypothetical protein [Aeromonas hydrophila]MCW4614275.1 hypothetical protein [Aeromonas hydrophila]MDD9224836.1 hypothetical protein [Aeromonas hydrophila]QEE13613.1 hypothetical protein C1A23_25540 [Aeromonas hydrophila subsp. hydrophila]